MACEQKNTDTYLNAKYPWDPTGWALACCAAITNKDRETAMTCLEMWDGLTDSGCLTDVLLAAMFHGFLLIAKKIIRRRPYRDVVLWHKLIACAAADCRSTAMLHFLEIEFLRKENNSLEFWRRTTKDVADITLHTVADHGDCLAVRICLRINPVFALRPSVIVRHATSPNLLWMLTSRLFEASEGTTALAVATREECLQHLETIASTASLRSPTTRAMARTLIRRALATFPPLAFKTCNSPEFVRSLRKKYSGGGEMEFH